MNDADVQHAINLAALLRLAFNELHTAVLERVSGNRYISPLSDYPRMAFRDNGFPYFMQQGSYGEGLVLDYVGTINPSGIFAAFLTGGRDDKLDLPQSQNLQRFVEQSEFASKFTVNGNFSAYRLERMIDGAVSRYIHLHGLTPLDTPKRAAVLRPLLAAFTAQAYPVRLVVPIALTSFEFDHFSINASTYVARIPKGLQLARSRSKGFHSGATDGVLQAATHALVSTNWSIEPDNINELESGLTNPGRGVLETIDLFFASLRAATGAVTGYAQVLMVPERWAISYYADLPQVFGSSIRRYPNAFDALYFKDVAPTITADDMANIKRIYNLIVPMESERIAIALKRLNACMTRDDATDAILDATIGLEVLLGKGAEAISYKIRMRAAALASLRPDREPEEVLKQVKAIYDFRSKVVHGDASGKRKGKKLDQDDDTRFLEQRQVATDMLRFIVDVLVEHPRYLDPEKIDDELLLGFFRPPENPDEPDLPGVP